MSDATQVVEPPDDGTGGVQHGPCCPRCGSDMHLAATLPQTNHFPVQRFYRCMGCRNVEMIDVT